MRKTPSIFEPFKNRRVSLSKKLSRRSDCKSMSVFQIFFNILGKLISAARKFSEHTVDTLLGFIPVIFCDPETYDRTYAKLDVGKSKLIKHQAASRVERFANDQSCFDINSAFVNDFF